MAVPFGFAPRSAKIKITIRLARSIDSAPREDETWKVVGALVIVCAMMIALLVVL
jgi:hypothetical protein